MTTEVLPFVVDPVRPARYSMSYVRAAGGCLRRAHYERIADVTGEDAIIGRVFHEGAAAVGFAVTLRGDTRPRPGEAVRVMRHVMARPEEHDPLPRKVWEEVLALADRWERWAEFRPGEQFEISAVHEMRGRPLSARIDRLYIDGREAWVNDYKSGWAEPPSTPRPTPQGDHYSWHVLQDHPDLDGVWFTADHVRFGPGRPYWYSRDEILNVVAEHLFDAVGRLDAAYDAGGELPANPGGACHAYGRPCPVAKSCPAKTWTRPSTLVETEEEALGQFRGLLVEEASIADRKAGIRGWLERTHTRALALNGTEIGFTPEGGTTTNWRAMVEAGSTDPAAFTTPKGASFGRRQARS